MDNKLTKLYGLDESLYSEGCPVVIMAGALYKLASADEKILLQLKLKNIGEKNIIAVKIALQIYDVSGNEIDKNFEHQYLDLKLEFNTEFTDPKGVQLKNKNVRSFDVKITEIVFEDGSVCSYENLKFAPLPEKRKLVENFGPGLIEQYKRDVGKQATYEPLEYKDLWFCCCGELNRKDENCCHRCKIDKSKQFKCLDSSLLSENKEAFEKEEKEQAEKRAEAGRVYKEAMRKKTIKGIIVFAVVLAIILGAGVLISKATTLKTYNSGIAMMESGNYDDAEYVFYSLKDYKDSNDKYNECIYQKGLAFYESGEFYKAIDEFERIPDYKDSNKQIELTEKERDYQEAVKKIKENDGSDMSSVKNTFENLGDYKDSEKYLAGFVERVTRRYQRYQGKLSHENYCYYDKEGYLSKMITTEGFKYTYEYSYSKDRKTVTVIRSYKSSGGSVNKSEFILKFDDNANIVEYEGDTFTYEYNKDNSVSRQIGKQVTNLGEVVETETIYSYAGNNLAKTEKIYSLPSSNTVFHDIHYFYYDENNKVESIKNDNFDPHKYEYGWFYAPDANEKSDLMTTLAASTMQMFF